ncbi:hypothetical protein FNF29_01619 [Cafeteria roenbergensis]|uniref:RBR-type E3 ubiquitin transferase n=1 Tax=Cafeteria roenbergensis TaxID=33653 RepID=A0A5A8CTI1_CAFRO|nr:hypothetical protein FNF29_01619 [Cafeteria roenbergensis]|eukprot:KAA0155704.1 hypothetical protein FNF29_01619 [Cafeteria roenbergensis]
MAAASEPDRRWKCPFCETLNPELFLVCTVCRTEAPAEAASPASPATGAGAAAAAAAAACSADSTMHSNMRECLETSSQEELLSLPKSALVAEILRLRGVLAMAQAALLEVDEANARKQGEKREQENSEALATIVSDLEAARRSGIPLPLDQRNFLALAELGRSPSEIADESCPVCYEDLSLGAMVVVEGCGHSACVDCMRGHVVTNVRSASIGNLVCMEEGCTSPLGHATVMDMLSGDEHADDREKYERFGIRCYLDGVGNSMVCPVRECQSEFIVEHGNAKVDCPACGKAFCAHCPGKPEWHDSTCEKYQEWARENGKADDAFEQLLKSKKSRMKPCPKCKAIVFKPPRTSGGACNWLRCRCKHTFCFLCLAGPLPSDHHAHFRGAGPCQGKLFYDDPATVE